MVLSRRAVFGVGEKLLLLLFVRLESGCEVVVVGVDGG